MKQIPWFQRKFNFSNDQNIFPAVIERLAGTPILLKYKAQNIPPEQYTQKPDGNWSMQENIGHLIDIEPVWQGRLQDILNGKNLP